MFVCDKRDLKITCAFVFTLLCFGLLQIDQFIGR